MDSDTYWYSNVSWNLRINYLVKIYLGEAYALWMNKKYVSTNYDICSDILKKKDKLVHS